MKKINLVQIKRTYHNNGQHAEQIARFNLTGKIEKADNIKATEQADCLNIQLKSQRATVCNGLDIAKGLENDKAELYGYISKDFKSLYIMDKAEYITFCEQFKTIDHDSRSHITKIRLKAEGKAMTKYLQSHTRQAQAKSKVRACESKPKPSHQRQRKELRQ